MLVKRFKDKTAFEVAWPASVSAMAELFGAHLILPDYRYELHDDALHATQRRPAANEIERALRRFWQFDERYFGEMIGGGRSDFQWAVYVLVYLGKDRRTIDLLFRTFLPLLGDYAFKEFGRNFCRKVCSTFRDDVRHLLWDVQDAQYPESGDWFGWHGHLNGFSDENRTSLLEEAGLYPLKNPSFPPFSVMQYLIADPVRMGHPSSRQLRRMLEQQYLERGYDV